MPVQYVGGDIRPEFPKHVETHVRQKGKATHPQGRSNAALVPRMISVVNSNALTVPAHREKLNMCLPLSRWATKVCSSAWKRRRRPLP